MAGRSDGAGGIAATGVARSTARGIVLAGVAVLGVLLWGGYVRHWAWTGFGDNDTLWDWLELALLRPAVATLPLWLRRRPLVHRGGRIGLAAACATFALLVLAGYLVPLRWTGFRGNTLWDWLNLLVLPVVLVFLGPWTDVAARVREHPRRHLLAFAVAMFVALAVAGYTIPMLWTGFPGNTLWDWLQLLLLPLLVPTVLGPALLHWIAVEESKPPADASEAPAARTSPRRAAIVSGLAAGILALSARGAVGGGVRGGDADPRPAPRASGPCTAPAARTLAAGAAGRVVRAGDSVFACGAGRPARRLGAAGGAARPVALRLGAGLRVPAVRGARLLGRGPGPAAVRRPRLRAGGVQRQRPAPPADGHTPGGARGHARRALRGLRSRPGRADRRPRDARRGLRLGARSRVARRGGDHRVLAAREAGGVGAAVGVTGRDNRGHGPRRARPPRSRPRPRPRLRAVGDAAPRARARDDPRREGLRRPGRARRARRDVRDEGRAAQRRARRRQGVGRPRVPRLALLRQRRGDRVARLRRPPGREHRRAREHAGGPQHGRVHAVLVLPVARPRAAARLVQVRALSLPRSERPPRRPARLRRRAAGRDRGPRVGLDRRDPLPRRPDAPRGHRRLERGRARQARDARLDGRHRRRRAPRGARTVNGAHDMGGAHGFGPVEPEPGEPVFHAEWERRAFALTVAMGMTGEWNLDESRFAREDRPPADYLGRTYYEIWLDGLERQLADRGLVAPEEVEAERSLAPARPVKRTLAAPG